MSIFGKFLKSSNTSGSQGDTNLDDANMVQGREVGEGEKSSEPEYTRQKDSRFEDTRIDDELPSVNRHRRTNNTSKVIALITLLGLGAIMLYVIFTPKKVVQKAVEKMEVLNSLPPLPEYVAPTLPAPPVPTVPVVEPIAVNNQTVTAKKVNNGPKPLSWYERKMGGSYSLGSNPNAVRPNESQLQNANSNNQNIADKGPNTWLGAKLKATATPKVSAQILPDRNYIITQGTALDCALETAIESSLSGLVTCRLTRDVYSDNGHVVLLDRGSQLVGEYQGGLTRGQVRVFLLWTRAKTPNGVVVQLESPGTDALGRTGNTGFVDTHFMERFGAAVLFSMVDTAIRVTQENGTNVNVGPSAGIANQILQNQINIPPTLHINQGDHVQVMVARDLDFSSVYELALNE